VIETDYRAAIEALRQEPIDRPECLRVDDKHWVVQYRYFNLYYRVWQTGRVVWLVDVQTTRSIAD